MCLLFSLYNDSFNCTMTNCRMIMNVCLYDDAVNCLDADDS